MKRKRNLYSPLSFTLLVTLGVMYMASCEKEADKPTLDNKVVLALTTVGSQDILIVMSQASL
ncbi:MAG: hypothetical protein IPF68_13055 [Bacteroidales bacterium]|nr:hypothetical protein [Bacteroidales bacterium]